MSTKKTSTTKPAGRAGKPSRAHSANPGTAMRAHGHVLIQTWASKELQAAIREYAKKSKKYISDILREVIGKEAEKWSGAAAGSLQVLRKVKTGGKGKTAAGIAKAKAEAAKVLKAGAPASKVAAKSVAKSKSKQKVAKPVKSNGKSATKSVKKVSGKPPAAHHGTISKQEVAVVGVGAESAAQGTQVET